MAVSLVKKLPARNKVFFNKDFRKVIEDHLKILKTSQNVTPLDVSNVDASVYHGDLYGLLTKYNVSIDIHWIVMRINGFTSPTQYTQDIVSLDLPNIAYLESLLNRFRANQNISK